MIDTKQKKTYSANEVNAFLKQVEQSYIETLQSQKERIYQLKSELEKATKKIKEYEQQKELISKAISEAIKKAEEIDAVSMLKYNQEIAQLQRFHDKWLSYYDRILKKYPLDDELIAVSRHNGKISAVLERATNLEEQFESETNRLRQNQQNSDRFESGFSFSEALNPKEDLTAIMKDLGILLD